MPVYFIRVAGTDYVKIGHSGSVGDRLASLQVSHPQQLVLEGSVTGGREVEVDVHKYFSDKKNNLRGEWFQISAAEVRKFLFENAGKVVHDATSSTSKAPGFRAWLSDQVIDMEWAKRNHPKPTPEYCLTLGSFISCFAQDAFSSDSPTWSTPEELLFVLENGMYGVAPLAVLREALLEYRMQKLSDLSEEETPIFMNAISDLVKLVEQDILELIS